MKILMISGPFVIHQNKFVRLKPEVLKVRRWLQSEFRCGFV